MFSVWFVWRWFEYFILYNMAWDNDVVVAYSRYSLCVCWEGLRNTKQPLNCFSLMLTVRDWLVSLSILHCIHPCTLRLNLNGINIYVLFTEYICVSSMLHFEIVLFTWNTSVAMNWKTETVKFPCMPWRHTGGIWSTYPLIRNLSTG
jgi:hypothetical protein